MRKQNLPLQKLMNQDAFSDVAQSMKYDDVAALYAAVGEGHVSTQSVIEKVLSSIQGDSGGEAEEVFAVTQRSRVSRNSDSGVLVRGSRTSS